MNIEDKTYKKRVFLFIDGLIGGGAQRQFVYLAKGLKERGYIVRCFTMYTGDKWSFYDKFVRDNNIDWICDVRARNKMKRIYYLLKAIKSFDPDVIIAYGPLQTIYAAIGNLICKKRLILSDRNTTQRLTNYERLKFFFFRFSDFIVPNSYSQGNFISKHYPNLSPKIKVITNLVDVERFKPSNDKPKNNTPRIICVSRIKKQKNVLGFLDAVFILKKKGVDVLFEWYGNNFEDDYARKVQEKVLEYGISEMVLFYPACENIEMKYQQSDGFCLPSFYEGFPNVLCEAMASGLPVAASNVCDNPYIVSEGENGYLFAPNDPNSIADALQRLVALSNDDRKEIGIRNRKRILEKCAEKGFLDKYESLINNPRKK